MVSSRSPCVDLLRRPAPRPWRQRPASARRRGWGCRPRPWGAGGRWRLTSRFGTRIDARLAVEFEEHLDLAVLVGFADGLQADLQRLAGVDLGADFFAGLHAVEEGLGRQGAHRAVDPVAAHVVEEHLGIHQVAVQILVIDCLALQFGADSERGPARDRPAAGACRGVRCWAFRPSAPSSGSPSGKPPGGWPRLPRIMSTTLSGKRRRCPGPRPRRGSAPG